MRLWDTLLPGLKLLIHKINTLDKMISNTVSSSVNPYISGADGNLPAKRQKDCFFEGPWTSQVVLVVKNPSANAGDARDTGSILGRDSPWRREWQSTPVFLPGKFHQERSLVG